MYHGSTYEVASMDDELPLIIFVISNLFSDLKIFSKLNFIKDYIDKTIDLDFEEKMLSTFEFGLNYFAKEWELKAKEE